MALDNETLTMLRESLQHVLTETSSAPLADRLAELGWDEVVAEDRGAALRTLFEVKGTTNSAADALGPALTAALVAASGDPSLSDTAVALCLPVETSRAGGDSIAVDAIVTAVGPARVAVKIGDRLAVVPTTDLVASPVHGIDGNLAWTRLTGRVAATDATWLSSEIGAAVEAEGRWLVATELAAIARHVVAFAVAYTGDRVQYGKPIAVFQALQHRLASAHTWAVGAEGLTVEASKTSDPWTAMVAKCMAGRAAEFACTQAQQCFGAIGFTWEHEFPGYLRRIYALDGLFGSWRQLEHTIGATLQATGVVPRISSL